MAIRLFVGIDLPEEVKDQLEGLFAGIPSLRWVSRESLHITLKFIGAVDDEKFAAIRAALPEATARGPFAPVVRLSGVGTFGRAEKSILWVGVAPDPDLLRLQKSVDAVLFERLGLSVEARAFHPHITLAKPKSFQRQALAEYLERHRDYSLPPIPVREFCLFSSRVTSAGAFYTIEERIPL